MIFPLTPPARAVISPDGLSIATYEFGEPDAPAVIAVHGFASSALLNWNHSGWTRDLTRAGFRVIALDQRGHGASGKPHDPSAYSLESLVTDVVAVLDAFMIGDASLVGYSLGGRVGWKAAVDYPERISRAVLGGIPNGDPLTRFSLDEARAFASDGTPVHDRLTHAYTTMASGIPGNDLFALIALVEGMRGGEQPDPENPPKQPVLFATGSDDPVLEGSKALASAAPLGRFFEIPGRGHFNAPTSKAFREAAIRFLGESGESRESGERG